jgi:hypothetical protein
MTEAHLALVEFRDPEDAEDPPNFDPSQTCAEAATELYKLYGTCSLRARRDALALDRKDDSRHGVDLLRAVVKFDRGGLSLEAARTAFQLLEWLESRGKHGASGALVEQLHRWRVQSPPVAVYFKLLIERVRELAGLAGLPAGPSRVLHRRLELLELLTSDPSETPSEASQ